MSGCGDNSTGTNGGGNGNGNGGGNGDGGNGGGTEPTFSNVQEIFNSSCATSGCHDAATAQNGVDLSSYNAAVNSNGDQCGEIIVANEPDNSPIVDKIEPNPDCGTARMPQGGPYLSDEEINLIRDWISEGAENN
ncbi:hypothetical protein NC796_07715 [Aliifodinibius sp. S!AR15-10]|nr:hypothetical protein [Aliifodinibius sp. S!AR15-10]